MVEITPFPGNPRKPSDSSAKVVSFSREAQPGKDIPQAQLNKGAFEAQRAKVEALLEDKRAEHRALEADLAEAEQQGPLSRLVVQRLKKRKLALKDAITKLSAQLTPDIIA